MPTLILIRHAEPIPHSRWPGSDETRPLSERGKAQAMSIAAKIADCGALNLLSAPHMRCVETAQLIGRFLGLEVRLDPRLHIESSFRASPTKAVEIWVAHSNNIPGALMEIGVSCDACSHASAWRVELGPDGMATQADYVLPA